MYIKIKGRYFAFRLGIGEYQWHCDVSERRCVVCTTTHVALLGIHRSAGEFADVWRVPLHRLSGDRLLVERTGRRPSSSSSSTTTSTGGGTILLISSEERMYRCVCVCVIRSNFISKIILFYLQSIYFIQSYDDIFNANVCDI